MWGDPNAKPQREEGDRLGAEDIENHVVIIRPVEYIDSMKVKDEYKDAIKLNVVDLTEGGKVTRGTLWFNRLIGTFKHQLGTPFFGYVTKEKLASGYKGWSFISLAGNAEWEPVAQQWAEANPDFFTEPLPEKREARDSYAHHEQGPAPDWAGPVAPRSGPPAPPAPRPAPPVATPTLTYAQGQVSGPPAPRVTPPAPTAAPGAGASMLERLKRQAEQPFPPSSQNPTSGNDQEPPY